MAATKTRAKKSSEKTADDLVFLFPENLIGHTRIARELAQLWHTERLPHATLFAGANGIGKRAVALYLAKRVLCSGAPKTQDTLDGCAQCEDCELVTRLTHPDLYVFDCAADDSSTDAVRRLLSAVALRPYRAKQRIVILDNAEQLADQSGNVLLKMVEEPPPGTFFCFLTSNPTRLPATLLSRCQRWNFDGLTETELTTLLRRQAICPNETEAIALAKRCDGSLLTARQLIRYADEWQKLDEQIELIVKGDLASATKLAKDLTARREELADLFGILRLLGRAKLQAHATSATPRLACSFANFVQNVLVAEKLIFERNLNTGLVLTNLFSALSPSTSDGSSRTEPLLSKIAI
jgi:DNA polymerase III delta' subunit